MFGAHGAKSPHEVERHGRIGMMGHARCFAQRVRCVVLRNVPGITVLMVLGAQGVPKHECAAAERCVRPWAL